MRWTLLALLMGCAACGQMSSAPDAGDDASGGDAANTDAALFDAATPDAPGAACGGLGGIQCPNTNYCDWALDECGADDGTGECQPRPLACPEVYAPVCGCDGNVYGNECEAHASGVDLSASGGCDAPEGMFPCGPRFCDVGSSYCRVALSDVVGLPNEYSCHAFPSTCGIDASCACLTSEPCGDWCEQGTHGGFTLTCPGG